MKKAAREVAIVGMGLIPWGIYKEKSMSEMGVEAVVAALKNANMNWREIETIACGSYPFVADREGVSAQLLATSFATLMGGLGIPACNIANACATGQSILREAYFAVASGAHDIALALASDKSSSVVPTSCILLFASIAQ